MANDSFSTENKIKWPSLLQAISREECILCIGPEVFRNHDGQSLEEQIIDYLKKTKELDEDVIVYPDGLFYFKDERKRSDILYDLGQFYKQSFPEAERIFALLVEIPFNLVIFLTPDGKFAEVAEHKGLPVETDFYSKAAKTGGFSKIPSQDMPLIYNLLGSIQSDESVVLTHDDLFGFLKSYFQENRMPAAIKQMIPEAKNFVCLGLPFEKWYMQLLLRILNLQGVGKIKYASEPTCSREILSLYDRFKITFVPKDIMAFVSELHGYCSADGLLRKPAERPRPVREEIREYLIECRLEEALDIIEKRLSLLGADDQRISSEIVVLQQRIRMSENQRNRGYINSQEHSANVLQVTDAIMTLVHRVDNL